MQIGCFRRELGGYMGKNTNNIYLYKGVEFHSIKALAEHAGVGEKTITARLRRGMTIDEACNKKDLRCHFYSDGNEEKSISNICREQIKDSDLIYNRLKRGYTLNEALNKPKKVCRQGKPILVNGILYNSISEALRKLDLVDKESIVRGRLHRGMKPNEAFCFDEKRYEHGKSI